jgi:hypothetical protein
MIVYMYELQVFSDQSLNSLCLAQHLKRFMEAGFWRP